MIRLSINNSLICRLYSNCLDDMYLLRIFSNGRAGVSTWSALATAFNTKPNPKVNLSLLREDTVMKLIFNRNTFYNKYLI